MLTHVQAVAVLGVYLEGGKLLGFIGQVNLFKLGRAFQGKHLPGLLVRRGKRNWESFYFQKWFTQIEVSKGWVV